MKKSRRSLIFSVFIVIAALILIDVILVLIINFSISDKRIKKTFNEFFKSNFNKAVIYKNAYFNITGNLVIKDLNISVTSDFNDNLNLIESKRTIIYFTKGVLFGGNLEVKKIVFSDAIIFLNKKPGSSFTSFFRDTFIHADHEAEIKNINLHNFKIKFKNSTIKLIHGVSDEKIEIVFNNVSADGCLQDEEFTYNVIGKIVPFKSKEISRSELAVRGKLVFNNDKKLIKSINSIYINNFDISYLNSFIEETSNQNILAHGGISMDMQANSMMNNVSFTGGIHFNNLSVNKQVSEGSFDIISNENLNIDIIGDCLNGMEKIRLKKFNIYDDNFYLYSKGMFISNSTEKFVNLNFWTNKIKLSECANNFSPFKDIGYGGLLKFNGTLFYDLKKNIARKMRLDFNLKDGFIEKLSGGKREVLSKDLNASININKYLYNWNVLFKKDKSDFSIKGTGTVDKWRPFRSRNFITIKSKLLQAEFVYSGITLLIGKLLRVAEIDMKRGYNEIYFQQKPLGIFVNNNDFNVGININKILINNEACLKKLKTSLIIDNGKLWSENFSLIGSEGDYTFRVLGNLKNDKAYVKIEGKAQNVDLMKLPNYAGSSSDITGRLHIDFEYELNGYRIAHLLEYTKGRFDILLTDGYFQKTPLQLRIQKYFQSNGYEKIDLNSVLYDQFSLSYSCYGGQRYIRNFRLQGDKVNFNARANFFYNRPLRLPVYLNYFKKDIDSEGAGKTVAMNIPIYIRGTISDPKLTIAGKKDVVPLSLFNMP